MVKIGVVVVLWTIFSNVVVGGAEQLPLVCIRPVIPEYNGTGPTRYVTLRDGNVTFPIHTTPQLVPIRPRNTKTRIDGKIPLDVPKYVLSYLDPRIPNLFENQLSEPASLLDYKISWRGRMQNGVARHEYEITSVVSLTKSETWMMCPLDVNNSVSPCDAIHASEMVPLASRSEDCYDQNADAYVAMFWERVDNATISPSGLETRPSRMCYDFDIFTFTVYAASETLKFDAVNDIFMYFVLRLHRKWLDWANFKRCTSQEKKDLGKRSRYNLQFSQYSTFAMTNGEYLVLVTPRHLGNNVHNWEPEIAVTPGQEGPPILEMTNCTQRNLDITCLVFRDRFYFPQGKNVVPLLDMESVTVDSEELRLTGVYSEPKTEFDRAADLVTFSLAWRSDPSPKPSLARITVKAPSLFSLNPAQFSVSFDVKAKPHIDLEGMVEVKLGDEVNATTGHVVYVPTGEYTVKGKLSRDQYAKLSLSRKTTNDTEATEISDFSANRGDHGEFNFSINLNLGETLILVADGDGGVSDPVTFKLPEQETTDPVFFKPVEKWSGSDWGAVIILGVFLSVIGTFVILYLVIKKFKTKLTQWITR